MGALDGGDISTIIKGKCDNAGHRFCFNSNDIWGVVFWLLGLYASWAHKFQNVKNLETNNPHVLHAHKVVSR
jgi:hypothetical protein